MQPSPWLDFSLRFRLDHRDFTVRRNEIDLAAGPEWLRARLGFADVVRPTENTIADFVVGREGLMEFAASPWDNWTLSAGARRDLKDNASINWNVGLFYEDECIVIGTGVSRSFTRDRDIEPGTVWHLTVNLKHAG